MSQWINAPDAYFLNFFKISICNLIVNLELKFPQNNWVLMKFSFDFYYLSIACFSSVVMGVWMNFRTPYVQEQVNIGSGPPGSKVRWFRSASNEPRFINTVTFDSKDDSPTLVMVHGYGASQGFFFRNFDALARRFRVIAIDQLG